MAGDTKERILDAALSMFADRGYAGTNMRELALALGLGKSALYKHFASKEDIWNALLDRMEARYAQSMAQAASRAESPSSCQEFAEAVMDLLDVMVHDKTMVLTRKLLVAEEFHDQRASELTTQHFLLNLWDTFAGSFSSLMEAGALKESDPDLLAFAFSTPLEALVQLCDRDPQNIPDALDQARAFVDFFLETHRP